MQEERILGKPPLVVAAAAVHRRGMRATFGTLKGNDLQRRSDPRLFRLACNSVRYAVILNVVALHGKLPGPRKFEDDALLSVQLERNAGGNQRQCVPPRDSY
jgi:hypothetical protein